MVQSLPEASPVKWHLAHTTWFFESFLLTPFASGYREFDPDFHWLFNSYYQSFARFPDKRLRASFSRPSLEEILAYRSHVDKAVVKFSGALSDIPEAWDRMMLGVHHEQQHQELILTDILHALATNPIRPVYWPAADIQQSAIPPLAWTRHEGGLVEVGAEPDRGFSYDNERPRHRTWLDPFAMANRLITNAEYAEFLADGGYLRPELWLSDGWELVRREGWNAPLYWSEHDSDRHDGNATNQNRRERNERRGRWTIFTLRGEFPLETVASLPVTHVSYYEADAFARWSGKRLPSEMEWEQSATQRTVAGNLLEQEHFLPAAYSVSTGDQIFGDCWEWTASAYLPYPGFAPLEGTLGEYNGKFMSGKMVLRGGSFATPATHIRASYRNFFAPETRWQFSGIRLAESSR